jgi:PST family polysaccharide transporter
VKDNLPALLVAPVLGASAFGYLQWSIVYSGMPVYLTGLVARLAFSAVARLQADPAAVGRTLEATLRMTACVGLPASAILLLWGREIIPLLFGERWLPALPVVAALTANMALGLFMGTMMSAWNGLGRVRESARLSLWWTGATYGLAAAAMATGFGVVGVAWAYSLATAAVLVALYLPLARELRLSWYAVWARPLAVTAAVLAVGLAVRATGVAVWPGLAVAGVLSTGGVWSAVRAGREEAA